MKRNGFEEGNGRGRNSKYSRKRLVFFFFFFFFFSIIDLEVLFTSRDSVITRSRVFFFLFLTSDSIQFAPRNEPDYFLHSIIFDINFSLASLNDAVNIRGK